jgi:predicted RNA methylase
VVFYFFYAILFACWRQKKTHIIVDLFAGTMATVAAALIEEHPVYACEPDETCFDAASACIHALQYRRVALIP